MFCVTAYFKAYRNLSAKKDEIPFLFLLNMSSFPRKLAKIRLSYVNEATQEEQEGGDYIIRIF